MLVYIISISKDFWLFKKFCNVQFEIIDFIRSMENIWFININYLLLLIILDTELYMLLQKLVL